MNVSCGLDVELLHEGAAVGLPKGTNVLQQWEAGGGPLNTEELEKGPKQLTGTAVQSAHQMSFGKQMSTDQGIF